MDFHARTMAVDGVDVVRIEGELDLASSSILEDAIDRIHRPDVVVDARGLDFVDVVGVTTLVRCHETLVARGGGLVVRGGPPVLRRVLDITGYAGHLPVDPEYGAGVPDDGAVQREARRLADLDVDRVGLTAALQEVIDAIPPVFGADGAGLMVIDEGISLKEVASSDEPGRTLELLQQEIGEGPCTQTLVEDMVVTTTDVTADERWPELAPRMVGVGVRAVLGVPTHLAGGAVAALNVYKSEPYEWTDGDVEALQRYNRVLERLIAMAVVTEQQDEVVEQLQTALESRVVIERATGLLMGKHGLDAVDAFDRLRRHARSTRRRVYDVAIDVLAGGDLP